MAETSLRFLKATRVDIAISEHASSNRIALVADGAEITYADLDKYVRAAAAWLSGLVKVGGAVAVFMDNSPEAIVAILGAMRAGRTAVPINTKGHA